MDQKTPNLNLYLLKPNQLQKELTINEALISIDGLINKIVKSTSLTQPPNKPQNGDLYMIPKEARHIWEDYSNHIALYNNGWRYYPLKEGFMAWVEDQQKLLIYIKGQWLNLFSSSAQP